MSGGRPKNKEVTQKSLDSYSSTSAITQATIAGPITAQSTYNEVVISVGRDNVVYQQIQGYDNHVVNSQTFTNSEASYEAFLKALNTADFTKGNTNPKYASAQGYCPLGQRYTFNLIDNGQQKINFWSTSCGVKTYGGNTSLTLALFQAQVPNYNDLTQGLAL